jgi:uncharacterized protein YyaL (SSP411 family)
MANLHFSPRPNRANEIHWREWNDSAFAEAQQADKPILLDISAVWCHWCHVMDETTYSDPELIALINERYIAIRADNDQRPDVNRRYNLGGWPTTAFLTPAGELLTGGTYIPPDQMRSYVTQVSDAYKNSKAQIMERIAEISSKREQTLQTRAAPEAKLSSAIVDNVLQQIVGSYDALYGGFGDEPKFPQTDALEFTLERYYETRDIALLPAITTTLTRMATGGMYDQVWGGFFRYSTTRDWSVPHYEKMLEDNAKLLALYVHAWQVLGDETFLKTIRSLLAYVELSLSDRERGGFYGSQDADEVYYTLPREEREKMTPPYVDRSFYTDWNALMVSAYLSLLPVPLVHPQTSSSVNPSSNRSNSSLSQSQWFLGSAEDAQRPASPTAEEARAFALKTLGRLWDEMYREGEGLYHSARENGSPQLLNQLSDLARGTAAFLDAYQVTGDDVYLKRARTLADLALAHLYDGETGSFWSEPPSQERVGLLRVPDRSMNENAAMADALMRLYRLTGEEKYRGAADKALSSFATDYERYSYMAGEYARAVDHFLKEPLSVHIVGPANDPRTHALQVAALSVYSPDKLVQLLDPARDTARLGELGYPLDGGNPRAFVCVGRKCLPPVSDAKGIQEGMRRVHENL